VKSSRYVAMMNESFVNRQNWWWQQSNLLQTHDSETTRARDGDWLYYGENMKNKCVFKAKPTRTSPSQVRDCRTLGVGRRGCSCNKQCPFVSRHTSYLDTRTNRHWDVLSIPASF
jgi:hypothetical protein